MKKIIAITLSLAFAASVSIVFAEELAVKPSGVKEAIAQRKADWEQWKTERQQKLENLKQEKATWRATFKEKLAKDKCARIEARIQERTAKFGTAKVKHMSAYNNLRNRVQKFITKFQAFYDANPGKGDVTKLAKLKTDFGLTEDSASTNPATLNSLINAFQASLTDFSGKLASTKKLSCVTTEGELKGSLSDARVYLQSVHANAAAIRTYVRTVILPDLLAVKKDIAKTRGETEDTEEDAKEDEDEEEGDENGETGTTDTTKPTVSITSPSDRIYTVAGAATISATATDNIGVTKVEFYDGSSLKETDTTSPYSYDWAFAIADNGLHPWTAKAYDAAGNTEVSSVVNLTVAIPTPTP